MSDTVDWRRIWNRIWQIVDSSGECYFSGGRFVRVLKEHDPDFFDYGELIEDRRRRNKSTSRRDYFRDVFMSLPEPLRFVFSKSILEETNACADPAIHAQIRDLLQGASVGPASTIPGDAWGATRLVEMLEDIDAAIQVGDFNRAVSLSYTALEGFYGAFHRKAFPGETPPNELIALAKSVKNALRAQIDDYPDEALALTASISHAVDRARNRFSEAHFEGEAGRWLAVYMRDLTHTQIRLLLHFM